MALTIFPQRDTGSSKAVLKYMLLPGVLPRLKRVGQQLSGIFLMFARVFATAGLIEPNHPCLRLENSGRYAFTDIIFYAWQNLELNRRNIPQVVMFFSVCASCLLFVGIICAGLLYLFLSFGQAYAQYFGTPEGGSGITYDVNQDWAFRFLERIFGGSAQTGLNFWIQAETPEDIGNPWFSGLLVGVMKIYSKALLLVASFMILYIIVVTLADAARSGRPFGESFDGIWAPLRFVLAVGLLVPIGGGGYNGAQLLVFQTAQWGSNMATNIWHESLKKVACDNADDPANECNYFSAMVDDRGYKFLRDIFLVNMCIYGYSAAIQIGGISDKNAIMNARTVTQTRKAEIHTFGNQHSFDFCGQVVLPQASDPNTVPESYASGASASFLPHAITDGYRRGAMLFFPPSGVMQEAAIRFAKDAYCEQNQLLINLDCPDGKKCNTDIKEWIYLYWKEALGRKDGGKFFDAYGDSIKAYNQWVTKSLKEDAKYGWASAGVFYLRISNASAALENAIKDAPRVTMLPRNYTRQYATPMYPNINDKMASDKCSSWFGGSAALCDSMGAASSLGQLLWKSADWFRDVPKLESKFYSELGTYRYDNALRMQDSDAVESYDEDSVMGPITSAIFEGIAINGTDINPLGTVIGWGNVLFTIASSAYTLAIALSIVGLFGFGAAAAIAPILETVGNILIIPGFVLMFVVPFLPFLYFMFAVVEWATAVLEAVIGIPLWVLTFIRRQGDLLGPAMGGIKMLFEIMLRPTIIIFSLLSAILIFTAGVVFFGDAMRLYMGLYPGAGTGHIQGSIIGPVMSLGLILIYMFGVYSLATSSFKLIDAIPAQFGRWLEMSPGFGSSDSMGGFSASGSQAAMGAVAAIGVANKIKNHAVNAVSEGRSAYLTEKDYQDYMRKKRDESMNSQLLGGTGGMPPPSGGNWKSTSTADGNLGTAGAGQNYGYPDESRALPGADQNYGYNEPGTNQGDNAENIGSTSTTGQSRGSTGDPVNNAYSTLGLNPNATQKDVREAYKKELMKTHPDNLNRTMRHTYFEMYKRDLMQKFGIQPKETLQEKMIRSAEERYGAKNVSQEERARIRKQVDIEYKQQLSKLTADQQKLLAEMEARYKALVANSEKEASAASQKLREDIEDAYKTLNDYYSRGRGGPERE